MLKKSAGAEKVEVQAKVEAKIRTSDLHSTLTSTSAFLLDVAHDRKTKKEGGGFAPPPS